MINEIKKAIEVLNKGGVILYPTDTIWGLGCDATNNQAIDKIYKIKNRNEKKSMIILLNNINLISRYVDEVPDIAYDLIEVTEKPITIIYPNAKNLPKNLVAEDNSIAIRITTEDFTSKLLEYYRKPIVSTSANISGEKSPLNYHEISEKLKPQVDYIINYNRELNSNKSSSIIKLDVGGLIKIIRE